MTVIHRLNADGRQTMFDALLGRQCRPASECKVIIIQAGSVRMIAVINILEHYIAEFYLLLAF